MKHSILIAAIVMGMISGTALADRPEPQFTRDFPLGDCQFLTEGSNRYFTLQVGRQLRYDNAECVAEGECDELEELVITVLDATKNISMVIDGVPKVITTRVVEEREWADGELVEVSRNWFAECAGTQDVYYFGEEVDIYHPDGSITHEGAWEAGVDGAKPGIIMPGGAFLLGARYFQEIAPGAMDRAEHAAMNLEIEVPAGDYEDCVKVVETTPLNKKEESIKFYCPGVGLVIDAGLELTSVVE